MGNVSSPAARDPLRSRSKGVISPILRLATVEHQLIMQCLQADDIIRLARSSTVLLQSAQSTFAFKHACMRLKSTTRVIAPRRDTSLLRFSSLHFTLLDSAHVHSVQPVVSGMPLRSLDLVSARSWTAIRWAQLCEIHFPHLTSLAFSACPNLNEGSVSDFHARFAQLLFHAPKLSSLDVRTNVAWMTAQNDRDLWREVGRFSIPRISICDTHRRRDRSHLPYMAGLPSLQRLVVRSPSLYGPDFKAVLSPLSQLLSLELHFFHCAGTGVGGAAEIPLSDFSDAFKALAALQQLRLFSCYKTHALIPHVVHAPALQTLEVDGDWMQSTAAVEMPLLSVAFADLLANTRGLHCTLIVRCSSDQVRSDPLLRLCDPAHSPRLGAMKDRFDFVVTGPALAQAGRD